MRRPRRPVFVLERGLPSLAVAALVLTIGCSPAPPSDDDYLARITAARTEKDAALRRQTEPVPADLKGQLLPLSYYAVDPAYNVPAALAQSNDMTSLKMVYSDGAIRDVRNVGTLEFTLNGQVHHLSAFVEVEARDLDHLFVPFGDTTNGTDTYPSGRLLDLVRTPTGLYEVDFNLAYNPSCYYSPKYSCPLPPKENHLPAPVRAGEKVKARTAGEI